MVAIVVCLIPWIEQADRIEDGPTERRVGTGEAIGRRDRRAVAAVEVGGGADGPGNDARTLVNAQSPRQGGGTVGQWKTGIIAGNNREVDRIAVVVGLIAGVRHRY